MGIRRRTTVIDWFWFEPYAMVLDAIAREKQLKGWTRVKKIWLIERGNPAWVDLSET